MRRFYRNKTIITEFIHISRAQTDHFGTRHDFNFLTFYTTHVFQCYLNHTLLLEIRINLLRCFFTVEIGRFNSFAISISVNPPLCQNSEHFFKSSLRLLDIYYSNLDNICDMIFSAFSLP